MKLLSLFAAILILAIITVNVSASQSWWDTAWQARQKLTFYNYPSENLVNFPLLIKLTTSNFNYSKAKSDGTDLRFIDADNSTELNYHIEEWNPSGDSFIWVKVPQISSSEDFIWLYYNNSAASDVQDEAGTYDSNYVGVWHLNELADGNLIDPSTWTVGTGSAPGFTKNGGDEENHRILASDPFGEEAVIWEARPDSVSDADGGWNGDLFNIDEAKTYRFSVWVKRTVQGSSGRFYLGLRGYDSGESNVGVIRRDTGDTLTNPYFWYSSSPPGTELPTGEWVLIVGHVWPVGSGTGGKHADSGRYTIADGKIGDIHRDYVWRDDNVRTLLRSYLYYSTDTSTRQQWAYPRVEVIDGTEPSIEDLLNDAPSKIYDASSNDNTGKVVGATLTTDGPAGRALSFDGVDEYVNISTFPDLSTEGDGSVSVEAWIKSTAGDTYDAAWAGVSRYSQFILGASGGDMNFIVYTPTDGWTYQSAPSQPNKDQWHHYVGTWNVSSGKVKLYMDGGLWDSDPYTAEAVSSDTGPIHIGHRECCNSDWMSAVIDEVRISNVSRSAAWINASYLSMTDNFVTFGSEETPDVTAPSIEFVTPTDPNGATISRNFTFVNVSVYDEVSDTSSFIDWNHSLVGYWSFEHVETNGTVWDNSTYGNHGLMQGFTTNTTVAGKYGKALEFDGVDDYVSVSDSSSLDFSSNTITLETWIYKKSQENNYILYKGPTSTASFALGVDDRAGKDTFVGSFWNDTDSRISFSNDGTYIHPDNAWYHLAQVLAGNKMYLYVNGQLEKQADFSGTIRNNNDPLSIGTYNLGTGTYNLNGTIDEVRIWNRALLEEEIKASYNSGLYRLYRNFTDLQDGATYEYYAYAIDEAGNTNQTETRTVTVSLDAIAPSQPVLLHPSNNTYSTNQNPKLNCTNVTEENFANYTIELADVPTFEYINYSYYTLYINDTNYTVTDILKDSRWYWRVTAYDLSGNANTSAYFVYTVDTLTPTLTFNKPSAANSTLVGKWFRKNITVTDENLWWLNCTIRNVSNNICWSREWNLTGMVNYVVTTIVDVASWPLGLYYENCSVRDLTER